MLMREDVTSASVQGCLTGASEGQEEREAEGKRLASIER